MASKFTKSKFRNGQRVSNDAKWTAVDMRSAGYGRGRRSSGSGIFGKALSSALRKSLTPKTSTPRYTKPKTVEDAHRRTTLTIEEMPPELRYLSYPHLKPKPPIAVEPIVEYTNYHEMSLLRIIWEVVKEVVKLGKKNNES